MVVMQAIYILILIVILLLIPDSQPMTITSKIKNTDGIDGTS